MTPLHLARNVLLFLLPTVITLPVIGPDSALTVGGVTLSVEKGIVLMLISCNVALRLVPARWKLPSVDRGLVLAIGLCLLSVGAGVAWSIQMGRRPSSATHL